MELLNLPPELLLQVAAKLPVNAQAALAQTCRALRALLQDTSLGRLQAARFRQRLALGRPVEPALLPCVHDATFPTVDVATAVLRLCTSVPERCRLRTVTFHVPGGSPWESTLEMLARVPSVRSLTFHACSLSAWDGRGLDRATQLESLVRRPGGARGWGAACERTASCAVRSRAKTTATAAPSHASASLPRGPAAVRAAPLPPPLPQPAGFLSTGVS